MEKEQRNRLQKATQDARRLLEEEFCSQLLQTYDIDVEKVRWAEEPGAHLQAEQRLIREKLVAWIEHKEAQINDGKEALLLGLREMAFTALNRFVALKLMEARELVRPCVSGGLESAGFLEFTAVAQGLLADQESSYRLYLETIFEDVSRELRALFDPRDPASLLWPKRAALLELLEILNRPELAELWIEDETLGWVYQYFNGDAERKKMREESSAPRNSRELAVRNQFFTPRYVVEFLTDNTLGRIWYEMRQGNTGLKDQCRYLVRRPNEVWLQPGEEPPAQPETEEALSQEELLRQPVYIPHRPLKDPREIRMLDPACGSMHFGLYAFDLYLGIYKEAWEIAQGSDEQIKRSEAFALFVEYVAGFADKAAFLRELPRLILQHNIHGVDIDSRATQIARLTLWMRAQRVWQAQGVDVADRPAITRSNVVCAEPMPGERELLADFVDQQFPEAERDLVQQLLETIFDKMQLSGEAGSLLKIEEEIRDAIEQAQREWQKLSIQQRDLFSAAELAALGGVGSSLNNDLQYLTKGFWVDIEERIYDALRNYAESTEAGDYQRRLFVEDAAHGFAFIDLCRKRYDFVVMNPPFGKFIDKKFALIDSLYPESKRDIAVAFVDRGLELLSNRGTVGALFSRRPLFISSQLRWREKLQKSAAIHSAADLGLNVLDDALVEVIAAVIGAATPASLFIDCLHAANKQKALLCGLNNLHDRHSYLIPSRYFAALPERQFAYFAPQSLLRLFQTLPTLEPLSALPRIGLQTSDDFRFLRLFWEPPSTHSERKDWISVSKGGQYAPFYSDTELCVLWQGGYGEMAANSLAGGNEARSRQGSKFYFKPALTYTERTASRFSARILPLGALFSVAGPGIVVHDISHLPALLGFLNSLTFTALIELCLGAGDSVSSGTAARHYTAGMLGQLPVPDVRTLGSLSELSWKIADLFLNDSCNLETSTLFARMPLGLNQANTLREVAELSLRDAEERFLQAIEYSWELEKTITNLLNVPLEDVFRVTGPHPGSYPENAATDDQISLLYTQGIESLIESVVNMIGSSRQIVVKSYVADRRLELVAHALSIHPREIVDARRRQQLVPEELMEETRQMLISLAVGLAFGLSLSSEKSNLLAENLASDPSHRVDPFISSNPLHSILVDDPGSPSDIVNAIEQAWTVSFGGQRHKLFEEIFGGNPRRYVRKELFKDHLSRFSMHRRSAPIYWPICSQSGAYTLWICYHRFTRDTLYLILREFVLPRIQEVEREQFALESRGALSDDAATSLQETQSLLQDLRLIKKELDLVAPLWNPNLNDGIIINYSLLWRITHHTPWQKKCKECWDKLVKGDYDWAHLAFHLWPERVIPKCVADRSLAIAHGLEERLWQETNNGNWLPRQLSEADLQAIVAENSNPAVKSALERFLAAPPPVAPTRTRASRSTRATGASTPRRARGSAAVVDAEATRQVLLALTAAPSDGLAKTQIADLIGVEANALTAVIKQLKESGQIDQLGERRGARYLLSEQGRARLEQEEES